MNSAAVVTGNASRVIVPFYGTVRICWKRKRRKGEVKDKRLLYLLGIIPAAWFGLLIAPYADGGLPSIIMGFGNAMEHPFHLQFVSGSFKAVLVMTAGYGLLLGIFLSSQKNFRRGEEHGSAKWGNAAELNRTFADIAPEENLILTNTVKLGLDGRKHRRNLNVLVVGGTGAGKTRFYAKPNVMQGNTSFVVLDPKGELLRDTGRMLESKGYDVKVINLIQMEKSHCYNPFVYIRNDNDIQKLVTNIFNNTTPKDSKSQDPFWDKAAQVLLLALMFYLHYEAPEEEQNFPMVMEMIQAGEVREDDETYKSPLDVLFQQLEEKDPEHIAVKYYKSYRSGSGKTLKSIQITLISRLEKFNLSTLASITQTDELELQTIGEKKSAIFCVIPDNDDSFNFIIGMLYTQLFQQLYYSADFEHNGRLPVHVHFLMDEFANVSIPDSFDKLLATMRSREISVSIIIQNMAQLKALFKDNWESIVGNCDSFLYLGGNELSTHKYVSELLGKETIDTNSYGESKGRSGSFTKNSQNSGRELLTPDEVRLLNNKNAILFIRGERPVKDLKYDIMKHPNLKLTTDGGAEEYRYNDGNVPNTTSIEFMEERDSNAIEYELPDLSNYELLSDEEMEVQLKKDKEIKND